MSIEAMQALFQEFAMPVFDGNASRSGSFLT